MLGGMAAPVRIVGSYLSPYVRKVLVALHVKGVAYEIDPIVPFFGDERFSSASPLRRIPVYVDGATTLCDSTVICQYLEDTIPAPPFYPAKVVDRARARWLEEYADTRMGDVFIWGLFQQVVIGPAVWGRPADKEKLRHCLEEDIPSVMDYLESQAPASAFLFGDSLSIADVSVATFFRNAAFARWTPDAARWPRTAAWIERALADPAFAGLRPFEEVCGRTPPQSQREALAGAGAPVSAETWGTTTPRAGVMPI